MKSSNYGVGILAILAGCICIGLPGFALRFIGWMLTIVLLLCGIAILSAASKNKTVGRERIAGNGMLVFGAIMLIFSLLAIFVPTIQDSFDMIIVIVFIVHLMSNGVNLIMHGVSGFSYSPVLSVLTGVLMLAAGIYGICSFFFAAMTIGVFYGLGLLTFGLSVMFGTSQRRN